MIIVQVIRKPLSALPKGFSLPELLLVLTLGCIFAFFTYPSYHQTSVKTGRMDAKLALFDLANRLENYYSTHHSYAKATIGTGKSTDVKPDLFSDQGLYTLSIDEQSKTSFTLRATARGKQIADTNCPFFTLEHTGKKNDDAYTAGHKADPCW